MAANRTKVVLLCCGSFNPITNMHLRMFENARDALHRSGRYSVIGGIISPVNDGYKKKDLVKADHRVEMCKLATKSSDWICVDDWEAKESGWLETAKVLTHMTTYAKQKYSGASEVVVKLLCGGDLLESFAIPDLWKHKDIKKIVGEHGIVVITREGSNPQSFVYGSDILTQYENNIEIVTEWITNDISSTKIRRSLRRNQSIKYLVPDPVIDYIKMHGLYKASSA